MFVQFYLLFSTDEVKSLFDKTTCEQDQPVCWLPDAATSTARPTIKIAGLIFSVRSPSLELHISKKNLKNRVQTTDHCNIS